MTFGEKIKEIRTAQGLSLQALAKKCNLSVVSVWNCEIGRTKPSPLTIAKLANGLNYSYEELYALAQQERN